MLKKYLIIWGSQTPNFKPLYALKVVPLQLSPLCPSRSLGGRSWLLRIWRQSFLVFADINEQLSFSEQLSNMKKIYEVKFHSFLDAYASQGPTMSLCQ